MQLGRFGVRGAGLGIMKTQGRIVLGLLLQEPVVKRFVYQPNNRIYECFCFCFFLEDDEVPLIQGFSDDEPLVTA